MNRIHTETYILDCLDLPLPAKNTSAVYPGDKWLVLELFSDGIKDSKQLRTIESHPTQSKAEHAAKNLIDHAIKNKHSELYYVYEITS